METLAVKEDVSEVFRNDKCEYLLDWCSSILGPNNKSLSFVEYICQDNALAGLIAQFCPVQATEELLDQLCIALHAAENYLGVSKEILNPAEVINKTIEETHVIDYLQQLYDKTSSVHNSTNELEASDGYHNNSIHNGQKERMLRKKRSRSKRKFNNTKPKQSAGMPSHGNVGKHSSRRAAANKTFDSRLGQEPRLEHGNNAPHHVKNDSGISEMDGETFIQKDCQASSYLNGNQEDASIPKINLGEVYHEGDVNHEGGEYEEMIFGGHSSSGIPPTGPRVTEVIQEDGQVTIEMEMDAEDLYSGLASMGGAQIDLQQLAAQGGMDQLLQMAMAQQGLVIDDGERLIVLQVEEETDSCESDSAPEPPQVEPIFIEELPLSETDPTSEATSTSKVPHPPSTPRTPRSSHSPRHRPLRPASRSFDNTDLISEYSVSTSLGFDVEPNGEGEDISECITNRNVTTHSSLERGLLSESCNEGTNNISHLSNESLEIVMTKGAMMLKELNEACARQVFPGLPEDAINEPRSKTPNQMASTPRGGNTFEVLVLPDSSDDESEDTIDGRKENGENNECSEIYVIEVDEPETMDDMHIKVLETNREAEDRVTVDTGATLVEVTEDEAKQYEVEISIDMTSDDVHNARLFGNEDEGYWNDKTENSDTRCSTDGNGIKELCEISDTIKLNEEQILDTMPELEQPEDPTDWMAASVNSLIESANEAIMRGIPKEQILASMPDEQEQETSERLVDSAIHASIIENMRLSTSGDFYDSMFQEISDGTPNSEQYSSQIPVIHTKHISSQGGPHFQPLLSKVSESLDEECYSGRSSPVSARTNDELLQLLETIGKQGKEMRQELDSAHTQECDDVSAKTIERLNKEVDVLRDENNRMHREVSHCRDIATKDKQTISDLENSVTKLQDLARLLREEGDQFQKQTVLTGRKAKTLQKGSQTQSTKCKSSATLTDKTKRHNKRIDTSELFKSIMTDASTQVFIPVQEDDIKHLRLDKQCPHSTPGTKSSAKATQMIDDILQQMSTIATDDIESKNALEAAKANPEYPDKWRTLSMTPLSADPVVLQLQKSLASATLENDLMQSKVKKASKEADKIADEMTVKLELAEDELNRLSKEKELLEMRYKGDAHEMNLLKDRITGLERTLLVAQSENSRLSSKLHTAVADVRKALEKEHMENAAKLEKENKDLKERMLNMESDKLKLQQDLLSLQNSQTKSNATIRELESSFMKVNCDKQQLQTEVTQLRNDYASLKKNMEDMEHLFKTDALVGKSNSTNVSSTPNDIHSTIMSQSEQVLQEIRQHESVSEETAVRQVTVPQRWEDFRNSIQSQLTMQSDVKVEEAVNLHSNDFTDEVSTRAAAKKIKASRDSDTTSISEELQAVESRISKELGIKIQLVGQVAARDALHSDESGGKWAYPREPSPIGSSTRASTPVAARGTTDKRPSSLNATMNASSESLNKTKLNHSDGDVTMNRTKTRNRPEPLKKPDVDPRKIKDYEELRKKRLALMLQAFTGRQDTDTLLEEARNKNTEAASATHSNASSTPTEVVTTTDFQDRETISARVKEIIARYSDTNVSDDRDEGPQMTFDVGDPSRKAQAANVPYYKHQRRQVFPHKRDYRPPGSEADSETDNETINSFNGSIKEHRHVSKTNPHVNTTNTDNKLTKSTGHAKHRDRRGTKHDYSVRSDKSLCGDRSKFSDDKSSNSSDKTSSQTHRRRERSASPRRSPHTSPSPRAQQHSPNLKQTNLNYSTSRTTSHSARSHSTAGYESEDSGSVHNHYLSTSDYSHTLPQHGGGYIPKSSSTLEDKTDIVPRLQNNAQFRYSSSELQTSDLRKVHDPYFSHHRESRSNVRQSPIDRTTQHDDFSDTASLVAKYTSSRSPVSPGTQDTRGTSESEFVVTRAGSIRRIDRNSPSLEKLSASDERLNDEVFRTLTTSPRRGHAKDDNRKHGHPSVPRSASANVTRPVSPSQERPKSRQGGSARSSPKSPSFPWHSTRGSQESLTHLNVTDEEKRLKASSSSPSVSHRTSSKLYQQPASPRFASLTHVKPSSHSHSSVSVTCGRNSSGRISPREINPSQQSSPGRHHRHGTAGEDLTTPRGAAYPVPSESLTRHTISSSLKTGASRAHQVYGNPTRPVLKGGREEPTGSSDFSNYSRKSPLSETDRDRANELIDSYALHYERSNKLHRYEQNPSFEKVIEKYSMDTDYYKPSDDVARIIDKYATKSLT